MEHTGKSEKELQAALKEWYTIDESPATVEQMVEAQNWVVTFFALTSYVTIQDKSIQPPDHPALVPAPRSHPVLVTAGAVVSCCLSDHVTEPDALI